jgi:phage FluMu protein Com
MIKPLFCAECGNYLGHINNTELSDLKKLCNRCGIMNRFKNKSIETWRPSRKLEQRKYDGILGCMQTKKITDGSRQVVFR